jgi:hypothetical protein
MTRLEVFRKMAEASARPLDHFIVPDPAPVRFVASAPGDTSDLFVWFEDTSARDADGAGPGIAGLPECLLPWPQDPDESMRIVDRDFAQGHPHLLSAVRLRITGDATALTVALYTSALSVGTVAWIGSGPQYERAWNDLYATDRGQTPSR